MINGNIDFYFSNRNSELCEAFYRSLSRRRKAISGNQLQRKATNYGDLKANRPSNDVEFNALLVNFIHRNVSNQTGRSERNQCFAIGCIVRGSQFPHRFTSRLIRNIAHGFWPLKSYQTILRSLFFFLNLSSKSLRILLFSKLHNRFK